MSNPITTRSVSERPPSSVLDNKVEGTLRVPSARTHAAETTAHEKCLPLSMRDDLHVVRQTFSGQIAYVVGDPLSLQHHRFNEQEFALLEWIDGSRSAAEIQRLFQERFAPHRIEIREIESYIIQFHEKNLFQSTHRKLGVHLHRKWKHGRYRNLWNQVKNPLALRFRGWNPDPLLQWLTPRIGWFLSKPLVVFNFMFMLLSAAWLCMHWNEFQTRLPSVAEFFSPRNWLGIGIVLAATKLLHELGHGIAATRFGGRCHELGASLLLLMPTLYINTSETWRLPNKWHRMAIAAAGMYVELCLAAFATWIWWYSRPGVIHYTALNIMASCSISTILFNGNPFLKYDGYFILSDWLEIPNLQQRSSRIFRDTFLTSGLGVQEESEFLATDRTKLILLLYAWSVYAFRFVVFAGIAVVLCRASRLVGLESIARWFLVCSLAALVAAPIVALVRYFWLPGRLHRVDESRARVLISTLAILTTAFVFLPLPTHVVCDGVLEPRDVSTLYAEHDGVLDSVCVSTGSWTDEGAKVAQLRNIDLELEVERVRGEILGLERQEAILRQWDQRSPEENRLRTDLRAKIATQRATLSELESQTKRLTLRANRSGHVLAHWVEPVAEEASNAEQGLNGLEGWTLPNSAEQLFSGDHPYFRKGDILCRIGDRSHLQVRLSIPQTEVGRINVGQRVRVLSDSVASKVFEGTVASIAKQAVERTSSVVTLRHGGSVEEARERPTNAIPPDTQTSRTKSATFEALVHITGSADVQSAGQRATARISAPWESAAMQLLRTLNRQFRFEL